MRQAAGRQGVGRLQPIRLLDDEAVCRRAAAAYADVLGADSGGVGVHVFRYGKAYVVNRPDRTANSILLVVDDAFKRIDIWGF
jgi:hypothetical protein